MYEITTRGGGGENLFSLSVFRPLLIHFENVAQLLQQLLHILEYPATILYKTILKKKRYFIGQNTTIPESQEIRY